MIDFLIAAVLFTWVISGILDYNLIIDGVVVSEENFSRFDKSLLFILCIIGGPITLKRHLNNSRE